MADIGNMHAQKECAVIALLYIDAIIQIFGIIPVNRDDLILAQVTSIGDFRFCNDFRCILRFLHYLCRKLKWQVMFFDYRKNIYPRIADIADHFYYFTFGTSSVFRPFCDFNYNFCTNFCSIEILLRNKNILSDFRVIRNDKAKAFTAFKCTDNFAIRSCHNTNNLTFAPFANSRRCPMQPYNDPVIIHCTIHR